METASNSLLQYGAIGAVLAVLLTLFTWAFRVILVRFLGAFDRVAETLTSLVVKADVHTAETNDHHKQTMLTIHNNQHHITQKLGSLETLVNQRTRRGTNQT